MRENEQLEQMTSLSSVILEGTPHKRGITHGEAFADEIEHNASFYYQYFAENGVDKQTARSHAEQYVQDIEDSYPVYAEEMKGVAKGSERPIEDVTIISLRHTILYSAYMAENDAATDESVSEVDGCTSFGLEPSTTANEHTYVGQNWDWKSPVEVFIMDLRRDDYPNAIAMTEAGNVFGKFGVNAQGIGFAVNGLSAPSDGKHPFRKPSHIRGRQILDSERFDQALSAVISEDRPTSRNYMMGHADGEIVDIETTPDSCSYLYPENGILTHANHFEQRTTVNSQFEKQIPDTVYRAQRLRKSLSTNDKITEDTIQNGLRDHFGKPKSVCRHGDEDDEGAESLTKVSLIMDLDERRLLATGGPPCEHRYHQYSVYGE
jgi:isopenicillin-N N-acyltransferase-like protein